MPLCIVSWQIGGPCILLPPDGEEPPPRGVPLAEPSSRKPPCASPSPRSPSAFAAPVYAQETPPEEEEDDLAFLKEGEAAAAKKAAEAGKNSDFSLYSAEDEDDLADFKVAPPPKPKAEPKPEPKPEIVAVTPPAAAKPLGDHFPARGSASQGGVVVELPVLIANSPTDVTGEYWLVAEVWSGGMKVNESRQLVLPAGVSKGTPTLAYVKLFAPVADPAGRSPRRQSRQRHGKPTLLFIRKVEAK
ncbi:MAG: hypothetical protein IPI35_18360 [Deltaproteobacteria bacterium]|nr:hypothetical protein [Deltaproteobacteria bacterium]